MQDRDDVTKDTEEQVRGEVLEGEVEQGNTKTDEKPAGNATMGGCDVHIS